MNADEKTILWNLYADIKLYVQIYLIGLATYTTATTTMLFIARALVEAGYPHGVTIGSMGFMMFIFGFDHFLSIWTQILFVIMAIAVCVHAIRMHIHQ